MSPNQKLIEQAEENGCVTKAMLLDTWFKAGQRDGKSAEVRYPSKYAIYEYYVDGKRYTILVMTAAARLLVWFGVIG